jgi:preprotein translocase subunit SecA
MYEGKRRINMLLWKTKKTTKIPYKKEIEKIHQYHQEIEYMTQDELIQYTQEVKQEADNEAKKLKAYAIMFEVIKRTLNLTPYDVQLSGGLALSEGNIAQMRTGEGKTITALFPAFWGYVSNLQTYVITVNEYLAERDYLQAKKVFDYLKIDIGLILREMEVFEKKQQYQRPVVYVTNTEFAFDYLRDNIAVHADFIMQGNFDFAIIDEADLVLIDEAKNPVIISGSSSESVPLVLKANEFVKTLSEGDYEIDEEIFIPYLTEQGHDKAKQFFGYELTEQHEVFHAVRQSLMAHFKLKKDVDYIVRDNEVLIVDKFTGRILPGRRFQQGLHQAIEAKENVDIQPENVPVAMTTYQNLFRKFRLLSGMTGTGIESKEEFREIYRMDVVVIPTNKPVQRIDHPDILFRTKKEKYEYLVKMVKEKHEKGQPVLIGTISVKESEEVAEALTKVNIPFHLLNAKNDKYEAEIVARAGEKGAVTIATNMAGRGTDIKISKEVEELGGLCVIGVSRNESKRIDRQLQGRSGRQGQKGESIFLTSLEDELLVMYPSTKLEKFIKKNKEYPVTKEIATKLVDEIQETVESLFTSVRKLQFQLDEILHYQREFVYGKRRNILVQGVTMSSVYEKCEEAVKALMQPYVEQSFYPDEWDISAFEKNIKEKLGISLSLSNHEDLTTKEIQDLITNQLQSQLKELEEKVEKEELHQLLKETALEVIDKYWMDFLQEVEIYKQGFAMSAMGESDPVQKFSLDMDKIFKGLLSEAYIEFFSKILQRGDILLTIATQSFYTIFPVKNEYAFQFQFKSDEPKKIKSVLYGERSIIDEFLIEGTSEAILTIPYALQPGKYVLRNYVNGEELQRIGFKILPEGVEEIREDAAVIYFRLPKEEMHPVDLSTYSCVLTHLPTQSSFTFEVPVDKEWIELEKPDNQNWLLGSYVIMVLGNNLPLYHKEFIVYPNEESRE